MPEILKQNPDLMEYAAFIKTARDYRLSGCGPEEAVTKAICEFQNSNIMGPFLDANASEVLNMLMTEWNTTEFGKYQRAEGREEGLAEGREEGFAEGLAILCKSIDNLTKSTGKTFDEAAAMLGLPDDVIADCKARCQKEQE